MKKIVVICLLFAAPKVLSMNLPNFDRIEAISNKRKAVEAEGGNHHKHKAKLDNSLKQCQEDEKWARIMRYLQNSMAQHRASRADQSTQSK